MMISDLPTPALVLDTCRLQRNINRMRDGLAAHRVPLRPHMKTAKSIDVAWLALAGQPGGITVSTLREAEYFASAGITDIVVAVGISPDKLDRAAKLQRGGVDLTLVLDHPEMARLVEERAAAIGEIFAFLIEIDSDGHRAGLRANDPALLETAAILADSPHLRCRGVMTHAGGSYGCAGSAGIAAMAEQERTAAVTAAAQLTAAGFAAPMISVGSTPTASFAEHLDGVTEVRAGIYMFGDLAMVELGVARVGDIAVGVLTTVISHRPDLGLIIVDAGGLALSKDYGPGPAGTKNHGLVERRADGLPLHLRVVGTNQEHGLIQAASADFARAPLGSRLLILPYHACMTAAAYDRYHVTSDGTTIDAIWERCNGW